MYGIFTANSAKINPLVEPSPPPQLFKYFVTCTVNRNYTKNWI